MMMTALGVSHRQACKETGLARSTQTHKPVHKIELAFIQPGKPMQNGFVERRNGNLRKELLNAIAFTTLTEVREKAEEW